MTPPAKRTKDEGRRTKDEGRRTKDEGRRTKDEGRRTKDEGRRTKDEGRMTKDEGRTARASEDLFVLHHSSFVSSITHPLVPSTVTPCPSRSRLVASFVWNT